MDIQSMLGVAWMLLGMWALERVREVSGDRASEGSNERGRLDHINSIARQALEATDDQ